MAAAVCKFAVDLIGDHEQILLLHDLGDLLQILPLHDGPGGVVGEGENQNLGLRRDLLQQFFRSQPEIVLLLQLDDHRRAVCQDGAGHVGDIAGLGNQHLVPRLQHGPQGQIDGLAAAHGHQDLGIGVVEDVAAPL